jgi:hypothetical protein
MEKIQIQDEHPGNYCGELKNLNSFDANPDPGSFVSHRSGIQDGKTRIRDKYPGSATFPDGPLGLSTPAARTSYCYSADMILLRKSLGSC